LWRSICGGAAVPELVLVIERAAARTARGAFQHNYLSFEQDLVVADSAKHHFPSLCRKTFNCIMREGG
jgi:hypothetical protein